MIEKLRLDWETGFLFWVEGHLKGQRAGSFDRYGYRRVKIGGRSYREHRVVWWIAHGSLPVGTIDHINGVRDDNRPCNLRESDAGQQMHNRKIPCNNTSGAHGVTRHKTGKWQAQIGYRGRNIHLGLFADLSDAVKARAEAEKAHGFHANHGRAKP